MSFTLFSSVLISMALQAKSKIWHAQSTIQVSKMHLTVLWGILEGWSKGGSFSIGGESGQQCSFPAMHIQILVWALGEHHQGLDFWRKIIHRIAIGLKALILRFSLLPSFLDSPLPCVSPLLFSMSHQVIGTLKSCLPQTVTVQMCCLFPFANTAVLHRIWRNM